MPAAKSYLIWLPIAMVTVLLLLSILFTYYNQQVIQANHFQATEAEEIRSNVSEVLWGTIHGIDIGLRGYAIVREQRFLEPLQISIANKDSLFAELESALNDQQFDMGSYFTFRDSINAYIDHVLLMQKELTSGSDSAFVAMFLPDKGERLWHDYEIFRDKVDAFEQQVMQEAADRQTAALNNLYVVQIALLLVLAPTMALYIYYFRKSLRISEELAGEQAYRAQLIEKQNEALEQQVDERTEALRMQMGIITSQHEELKAMNNAKDKIFSVLSHDLRGPLGNLQSSIAGFRNKLFTPEESDFLLQNLETNFEQTNELLNNLLLWSKSQLTGISVEKDQFNLSDSLTDLTALFSETQKAKNITIINHTDQKLPVKAGKEMIELVLRNLITNALKFTPEGGVINITARGVDHKAVVEISDSGVGMNNEMVENILHNSHVASTPGTNKEKGSGMGLLLVKEFIKLHEGTFEIISKQGKGTTIRFSIPVN